jgi:hypothetical protein
MKQRSPWFGRSLVRGALAALAMAAGCAKPSAPPEQFVGTWVAPPPGDAPKLGAYPTLTLAADGTGVYTPYPAPHPVNLNWVLKGDKLVTTHRDGSGTATYSYRFTSRDELVVTGEEGNVTTFQRYGGREEAAAKPKAAAPSPTTGGSRRPPARSRR